ncbi:hypothetical protein V1514DRAFT_332170 [Lipomyces japonicus]|uniref:uncharacterized protein n=1 Tax=Lipomyces japonicus TaxID=56871 RepID=UPI0034CFACB8
MSILWQSLSEVFPPTAKFTDHDVPDLTSKCFLVTGGTSGIGLEVAKVLYAKNATVYITSRSVENFDRAKAAVLASAAESIGKLEFVELDLMDLASVRTAGLEILGRAPVFDVVWYNAGIMGHATLSATRQGHEIHWGANAIGHFLLHRLISGKLIECNPGARVIWLASDAHLFSPAPDGVDWSNVETRSENSDGGSSSSSSSSQLALYGHSKAAAILLAHETARRQAVLSVSVHPGHLKTGMQENRPKWVKQLGNLFSYDPKYGAYTELFAGFSDQINEHSNGAYVIPWGRIGRPRSDILEGLHSRHTGERLWNVLSDSVKDYL